MIYCVAYAMQCVNARQFVAMVTRNYVILEHSSHPSVTFVYVCETRVEIKAVIFLILGYHANSYPFKAQLLLHVPPALTH
jgi:hypothetical protein